LAGVGNNDGLMSEINVTPFVDVMLVLLIIFMVTAPMMVQGLDVALPEAETGPVDAQEDQLIISIDNTQSVYINDLKVSVDFLQEKLAAIIKNKKNRDVLLKADRDIPYGIVVRVMSEVKGAGIEKLGMLTEPIKEKK